MTNSKIGWTTKTWNPTTGCDQVSPGCDNCYALTLAARLKANGAAKYQNDGPKRTSGPGFGLTMHDSELERPLAWQKPGLVFVNSMSDLFHSKVETGFIAAVWAVMGATGHLRYQILTKRPQRAMIVLNDKMFPRLVTDMAAEMGLSVTIPPAPLLSPWMLSNVGLGVSVESTRYVHRIGMLREIPAAMRFVSAEPLLGPLGLTGLDLDGVDWLIAGGESGDKARPAKELWFYQLAQSAAAAGVPFFMKQLGTVLAKRLGTKSRKGEALDELPSGLQIQDYPPGWGQPAKEPTP